MKKLDFILDTDVGCDCDDMMALAYLIYAKRHLNVNIKAITHSNTCESGIPCIRAMFRELGEEIPVMGEMYCDLEAYDNYSGAAAEKFAAEEDFEPAEDAVKVLRRALAESERAMLCAVGPFTNIAKLLESNGDEISPLDGIALVKEKCEKLVVMAGGFVAGDDGKNIPEWNVLVDAPASAKMVKLCPVPMVFLPFETGLDMLTGRPIMDKYGEDNVLSLSFNRCFDTKERGGRHSWDPATLVYAIEGCRDFFVESEQGNVSVDEKGRTEFSHGDGMHSILTIQNIQDADEQAAKDRIAAYIDSCAVEIYNR